MAVSDTSPLHYLILCGVETIALSTATVWLRNVLIFTWRARLEMLGRILLKVLQNKSLDLRN